MLCRVLAATAAALMIWARGCTCHADSVTVEIGTGADGLLQSAAQTESQASGRRSLERVAIPGFGTAAPAGNPALPRKLVYVALPPDADLGTLKVWAQSTDLLPGAYDVAPALSVAPAMGGDRTGVSGTSSRNTAARNAAVYGADAFYPPEHVRIAGTGRLRAWNIAELEVAPYCWNPASGKLRELRSDSVTLVYSRLASAAALTADRATPEVSDLVVNARAAAQWYATSSAASAETADYVVITSHAVASLSTQLSEFAAFQALRGFKVKIVTESDWGGGVGDAAAEHIRAWLRSRYLELGIRYVLLIGNPDPATGDVPMKMLWPRYSQPSYRDAPSDYYYADLTGNWDLDGDGHYGEQPDDFGSGGVDRLPEVYVGRIPFYGEVAELDRILSKTIRYESDRLGEWRRRLLLAMKPLDEITPSYQLAEQIRRDVAVGLGYSTQRVYDQDYGLNPSPERTPCTYDAVQQEWAQGAGFTLWMTHGGSERAEDVWALGQCAFLDDSKPAIVYAASCYNGHPEDPNNLACSLLRQGGVNVLAASRAAWYYVGETDFICSDSVGGLGYQYVKRVVGLKQSCARAVMNARLAVPMCIWPNQLVMNIYGDPSLVYDQPTPGAVTGHVTTDSGAPIADATLTTADGAASTRSAQDGSFALMGISGSCCDLLVQAQGFYSQRFRDIPLAPGKATDLTVRLVPARAGSISGYVYDAFDYPIVDATVQLREIGLTTRSLDDGSYSFAQIPPGVYTVTATKPPYAEAGVADCVVNEDEAAIVDIVLVTREGNAVLNGSFELGFSGGTALDWQRFGTPAYAGCPAAGTDLARFGAASQKIELPQPDCECCAGVYQVVNVLPGRPYSIVAWQRNYFGGDESSPSENVMCRVGFDPTGGIDFTAPTVIWRDFTPSHDLWLGRFSSASSYVPRVTIFLGAWRKLPEGGDDCAAWFDGVTMTGPVEAPGIPLVKVHDRFQSDTSSVSADWSCSTPKVSCEYAVSSTAFESGIVGGGGWVSVGAVSSATRTGLALANGDVVRVLVRARNDYGAASETGVSERIRIVSDAPSASAAKHQPDGTWVRVRDVVVSKMGEGPECFVQAIDRASGMRVTGDWRGIPFVDSGTKATVIGRVTTEDGVSVISNAELWPSTVTAASRPLCMIGSSVGHNNTGLLVTVAGRVNCLGPRSFVMDDGSLANGLRVQCRNGAPLPRHRSWVRVTGIATPGGVLVHQPGDISEILPPQ